MAENIQRDRRAVPALDSLMQRTADARADQLADALVGSWARGGDRRALIRLALDFWTWRRLSSEGLDDDAAADLMTAAASCSRPRPGLSRSPRVRPSIVSRWTGREGRAT